MIRNMREKGMNIKSIAKELNISRNSVRKYLKSEPKNKQNRRKGSKLDTYREKIRELINKHNLSSVRILEEIRKIGYNGVYCFSQFWTIHEKNYDTVSAVSPPFSSIIFLSLLNMLALSIFDSLILRSSSGFPL